MVIFSEIAEVEALLRAASCSKGRRDEPINRVIAGLSAIGCG